MAQDKQGPVSGRKISANHWIALTMLRSANQRVKIPQEWNWLVISYLSSHANKHITCSIFDLAGCFQIFSAPSRKFQKEINCLVFNYYEPKTKRWIAKKLATISFNSELREAISHIINRDEHIELTVAVWNRLYQLKRFIYGLIKLH